MSFHSELDETLLQKAKEPTDYPRVILSSSLAERAVTIPDVDYVIDLGLCRDIGEFESLLKVRDFLAPPPTLMQRLGRVGRVKPGCCVLLQVRSSKVACHETLFSLDSLQRVLALEPYHEKILAKSLSLCDIPSEVIETARQELTLLAFSPEDLWKALTKIALPLKESAILLRAVGYKCGFEAAAILCFKTHAQWKKRTMRFEVSEILDFMTNGKQSHVSITRLHRARDLFDQIREALDLRQSRLQSSELLESLSVAFLLTPERLVWASQLKQETACFLGEPLNGVEQDGYFVVALVVKGYRSTGLEASLTLPCTQWVVDQSGIRLPTQSAKIISDSTFSPFRIECCLSLRQHGYDVKCWYCKGGATEGDIAAHIATSCRTDLCIAAPNGNGLALRTDVREPRWLKANAEHIGSALRATSHRAVVFVGDDYLSPGLLNAETYAVLVKIFHNRLRDWKIPVVHQAPGITLAADGIHWCATSGPAIKSLMEVLIQSAVPTITMLARIPPPLWHWVYDATFK